MSLRSDSCDRQVRLDLAQVIRVLNSQSYSALARASTLHGVMLELGVDDLLCTCDFLDCDLVNVRRKILQVKVNHLSCHILKVFFLCVSLCRRSIHDA